MTFVFQRKHSGKPNGVLEKVPALRPAVPVASLPRYSPGNASKAMGAPLPPRCPLPFRSPASCSSPASRAEGAQGQPGRRGRAGSRCWLVLGLCHILSGGESELLGRESAFARVNAFPHGETPRECFPPEAERWEGMGEASHLSREIWEMPEQSPTGCHATQPHRNLSVLCVRKGFVQRSKRTEESTN